VKFSWKHFDSHRTIATGGTSALMKMTLDLLAFASDCVRDNSALGKRTREKKRTASNWLSLGRLALASLFFTLRKKLREADIVNSALEKFSWEN
jgi:hypothetical protein